MFLTNTLVVMRTCADSPIQAKQSTQNEDWDIEESASVHLTLADQMKTAGYYFFLSIVDYLQSASRSKQADRMSHEMEFEMWKRVVTNKWTINEKVTKIFHRKFDGIVKFLLVLPSSLR